MENEYKAVWPEVSELFRDALEIRPQPLTPQQVAKRIYGQVQRGEMRPEDAPKEMENYVRQQLQVRP